MSARINGENASTRLIPLSQGKSAIVDAADFERLNQWKWAVRYTHKNWYAFRLTSRKSGHKNIRMHREIVAAPSHLQVDHINGNGLDNRRSNLRLATNQQNNFNTKRRSTNTSGFKGVSLDKRNNRWRAYIVLNGKQTSLGVFAQKADAAKAYADAAPKFHGDFANTGAA